MNPTLALCRTDHVMSECALIEAALALWPKTTVCELCAYSKLDHYMVANQIAGLDRRGIIRWVSIRRCGVTGNLSATWECVE